MKRLVFSLFCLFSLSGFGAELTLGGLDLDNSKIFAGGWTPGPQSAGGDVWEESSGFPLQSTNSSTELLVSSTTWIDDASNEVTYDQSSFGGLVDVAEDGVVQIGGRLESNHDVVIPGEESIWYGTIGAELDLVFLTEVEVSIHFDLTNSLSDPTASYRFGADVFEGASWENYLFVLGDQESTALTDTFNYTGIFSAGTYRFDLYQKIWTEPSFVGGTLENDWTVTVTPVPEPSSMALVIGLLAGLGLVWKRARVNTKSNL